MITFSRDCWVYLFFFILSFLQQLKSIDCWDFLPFINSPRSFWPWSCSSFVSNSQNTFLPDAIFDSSRITVKKKTNDWMDEKIDEKSLFSLIDESRWVEKQTQHVISCWLLTKEMISSLWSPNCICSSLRVATKKNHWQMNRHTTDHVNFLLSLVAIIQGLVNQ